VLNFTVWVYTVKKINERNGGGGTQVCVLRYTGKHKQREESRLNKLTEADRDYCVRTKYYTRIFARIANCLLNSFSDHAEL
jgi:hypothetical protein